MDGAATPDAGKGIARRHAGLIPVAEYMRMSTDHQKYSIEFQCAAVRSFAVKHKMTVVRTYLDDGRSGLNIKGRFGLQSLLRDVISRQANYVAILVYDVSRWGRFQDTDESAYYEFMCKQAGVKVIYCSEPFDDTPMGGLFKNIKRVMAGEYSRGLSARVWGGQAQSVRAGFKPGGAAGYGLRRYLVSYARKPKVQLRKGEWKILSSDRVILIPGPKKEVETVWWIYDAYILDGKEPQQIADELNARCPKTKYRWTRRKVHAVLSHPKYIGECTFNRTSRKLRTKLIHNPEAFWIRKEMAFAALVSRDYFERAAEIRRNSKRKTKWTKDELKSQLRRLLREEGHLSSCMIQKDRKMADAQTFINHFGSMQGAFEAVGYCSLVSRDVRTWNRERGQQQSTFVEEIQGILHNSSIKSQWDEKAKILWVSTDRTMAIAIGVFRCYIYHNNLYWHIERLHTMKFDQCLMVRMSHQYAAVHDYHLIPYSALPDLPKNVFTLRTPGLAPYRLNELTLLPSRWRMETRS